MYKKNLTDIKKHKLSNNEHTMMYFQSFFLLSPWTFHSKWDEKARKEPQVKIIEKTKECDRLPVLAWSWDGKKRRKKNFYTFFPSSPSLLWALKCIHSHFFSSFISVSYIVTYFETKNYIELRRWQWDREWIEIISMERMKKKKMMKEERKKSCCVIKNFVV